MKKEEENFLVYTISLSQCLLLIKRDSHSELYQRCDEKGVVVVVDDGIL
jgi:hypothetical protein